MENQVVHGESGISPTQCLCGVKFSHPSNLRRHISAQKHIERTERQQQKDAQTFTQAAQECAKPKVDEKAQADQAEQKAEQETERIAKDRAWWNTFADTLTNLISDYMRASRPTQTPAITQYPFVVNINIHSEYVDVYVNKEMTDIGDVNAQ